MSEIPPDASPPKTLKLPSLDLDGLMKQALPQASADYVKPTIAKLRDVNTAKQGELGPVREGIKDTFAKNREEAQAKYDAIEPLDVQPWTQKRPENDPMRTFGSLGSVFAQMASLFTNQPMVNALNGSAAAMNAMRKNDLAEYQDAYNVWQDNTRLALKRHDAQREEYQTAIDLMKTDMAQGQAMLTTLATKYGDDAVLAMNEAGLYKELNQVMESRQRAALGMLQVYPKLLEEGIQAQGYLADPDSQSADPAKRAAAYQRWFNPRGMGAGSLMNRERAMLLENMIEDFRQKNGREPTITERMDLIDKANAAGTARGAKDAKAAQENKTLITELDSLVKMIQANPKVVGGRGLGERAKEFVAGTIDPTLNVQTPSSDFEAKLVSLRQRVNQALTGSKYYSKLRQDEMKKIMPGLEGFTSAPQAINALKDLRAQLAGADTDEPEIVGAPAAPPQNPPEGFTEKVTNPAGKVGYKNPATGKIWVP